MKLPMRSTKRWESRSAAFGRSTLHAPAVQQRPVHRRRTTSVPFSATGDPGGGPSSSWAEGCLSPDGPTAPAPPEACSLHPLDVPRRCIDPQHLAASLHLDQPRPRSVGGAEHLQDPTVRTETYSVKSPPGTIRSRCPMQLVREQLLPPVFRVA